MERLLFAGLLAPVFLSFYLVFVGQLIDTSHEVSDKAVMFATEMDAAVPCATRGIPLGVCSPNLLNTSFDSDMEKAQNLSRQMVIESSAMLSMVE